MIATPHTLDHDSAAPLPPLTEHDAALFQQLAEARFDLLALSAATNHRLADLLDWYFSPPIQARVEALRIAAEQTAALWAAKCRPAALRALDHLSETVEDPIERRRAASSLAAHARPQPLSRRTTRTAPAAADPAANPPDQPQTNREPTDAPRPAPHHSADDPVSLPQTPARPATADDSPTPAHAPEPLHASGPAPPPVRSAA